MSTFRVGQKRPNSWYDLLDGMRVELRPFDAALDMQAIAKARPEDEAPIDADGPLEVSQATVSFTFRYTIALAELYIVSWQGVLDENEQPVEPTQMSISEVVMFWPGQARALRQAFDEHFGVAEKNGSGRGRSGATPEETATVTPAPPTERLVPRANGAGTGSSAPTSPTSPSSR